MLSFLSKPLIGDLVIRILDNDDKKLRKLDDYLLISTSTKTRTSLLKDKIHGLLKVIPIHRMLLIFSGNVLSDKSYIPIDSFELSDITDEDTVCFRSRLCLFILPRSKNDQEYEQHSTNDQEIIENKTVVEEIIVENHKVRRKARCKARFQLEEFDLLHELETIQCEKFAVILKKYGYDNEGAFASISLKELCGSGLWIPMNVAKRIIELAAIIQKRLDHKDKKQMTIALEIEHKLIENKRIATVAIEGLQTASAEEDGIENIKQEFSKKVDVRRAWEKEEYRKKHNSNNTIHKELNTLLISRKCHTVALQSKINKIRQYFELIHNLENDKDFIEPARILYQITSQHYPQPHKKIETKSITNTSIIIEPSSVLVLQNNNKDIVDKPYTVVPGVSGIKDTNSTSSSSGVVVSSNNNKPTKAITDYKLVSYFGVNYPIRHRDHYTSYSPLCCSKHTAAITSSRESYTAYRKTVNTLELQILLKRLQSTKSGYIKSKTLEALALQRLKQQHHTNSSCNKGSSTTDDTINHQFTSDLITNSSIAVVEHSLLDLTEQRRMIKYVQFKEFYVENLFSVLPVKWYNPKKFIDNLVDILEQLDREMLIS